MKTASKSGAFGSRYGNAEYMAGGFKLTVNVNSPALGKVEVQDYNATAVDHKVTRATESKPEATKGSENYSTPALQHKLLTAVPMDGAVFVRWDDGVTSQKRVVKVDQNMTLCAEFKTVANNNEENEGSEQQGNDPNPENGDNVKPSGENPFVTNGGGGGGSASSDPSVGAPSGNTESSAGKAKAFVKKYWWAILIVAYIVYKNRK